MIETLNALAEPNRLRMVELLREGALPVNAIVERLGLSQPLVSKHLRALSRAGLVTAERHAQQRIYRLAPGPFLELDGWTATFRRLWEQRLDRLEDFLAGKGREAG